MSYGMSMDDKYKTSHCKLKYNVHVNTDLPAISSWLWSGSACTSRMNTNCYVVFTFRPAGHWGQHLWIHMALSSAYRGWGAVRDGKEVLLKWLIVLFCFPFGWGEATDQKRFLSVIWILRSNGSLDNSFIYEGDFLFFLRGVQFFSWQEAVL